MTSYFDTPSRFLTYEEREMARSMFGDFDFSKVTVVIDPNRSNPYYVAGEKCLLSFKLSRCCYG